MGQHTHKRETLPHMKRIQSRAALTPRGNNMKDVAGEIFNHTTDSKK